MTEDDEANSECEEGNPTFFLYDEKILAKVPEDPVD